MMAGILIIYLRVLISWNISSIIFNLGGTTAAKPFFDAMEMEMEILSPAERSLVRVHKAGTHVSNLDWRRPINWSTPEKQIKSVSESVYV
jgi:hypothetical protein